MKLSLSILALALLACVPDTHMSKSEFVRCVQGRPDEVRIAKKYGVPQTITKYESAQSLGSSGLNGTTWIYTANKPRFFHFDALGKLIPDSNTAKKPHTHGI